MLSEQTGSAGKLENRVVLGWQRGGEGGEEIIE